MAAPRGYRRRDVPPPAGGIVPVVVGFYAVLAIIAYFWHAVERETGEIWRSSPDLAPAWIALGLGLGVATGLGVVAGFRWLEPRMAWIGELKAEFRGVFGGCSRGEILVIAGASALGEELLFRGAMLPAWGWLVSTAAFALLHVPPRRALWPWTASAFVLGGVLGGLTMLTGNLAAAVVAHFLINALNLAYVARDRDPHPGAVRSDGERRGPERPG